MPLAPRLTSDQRVLGPTAWADKAWTKAETPPKSVQLPDGCSAAAVAGETKVRTA